VLFRCKKERYLRGDGYAWRVVSVDDMATVSLTIKYLVANVQSSTWNSLDLFELLVQPDDHENPEVESFVRKIVGQAVRLSTELVHMGLLQVLEATIVEPEEVVLDRTTLDGRSPASGQLLWPALNVLYYRLL